ncbi:MAG TPA: hypothetical protein VL832_25425 [Puia sp.]|nr:hypothetical protein [Puia sp.]
MPTSRFIKVFVYTILLSAATLAGFRAAAQAELAPWGNLTGIRVGGQLMEFESRLVLVRKDWTDILFTGKEMQRPKYERKGGDRIVTTALDQLTFIEKVRDSAAGSAIVTVGMEAMGDQVATGVYLSFALSMDIYKNGHIGIDNQKQVSLTNSPDDFPGVAPGPARSINVHSSDHQFRLDFEEPTSVLLKKITNNNGSYLLINVLLQAGNLSRGATIQKSFVVKASGQVDKSPVHLTVNAGRTGRVFDGFGGNFRLQNPKMDPPVIQYCLDNLRVAWGRVEMPWRFWQPGKDDHPIDSAQKGKLHPAVRNAMEMAQRLSKKGMPIILSAWFPPGWAVVGPLRFGPGPDKVWGNPLEHAHNQEIYQSIADYITYLRDEYGVTINYFSFNESDLGINIRQTGQEHDELIKGLGAYFEQRGLKTKMLLGDNSDATTYSFIGPALDDTASWRYIGAVSFHSWRGWDSATLQKWSDAATRVNRPLIIAEGSIDAQAWGYPAIFEEPTYALEEINLYVRLLSICQPASILQWQLTSDYSPLSGGGMFGNNSPLHPTQRFWNLKQLASTPAGYRNMPATSDNGNVTIAVLGDATDGKVSIHLVNRGASRVAKLTGLPAAIKTLHCHITDKDRSMQEGKVVPVSGGAATFTLESGTYTTLSSD